MRRPLTLATSKMSESTLSKDLVDFPGSHRDFSPELPFCGTYYSGHFGSEDCASTIGTTSLGLNGDIKHSCRDIGSRRLDVDRRS